MNHDFTHCVTEECPLRNTCKRSIALKSANTYYVSMADFYDKNKPICEYYINYKP